MAMSRQKEIVAINILIFMILLRSALAIEKCRKGCSGDSGILNLKPGTTYQYDYEGKINIELSNDENQKTSTEFKANVLLTQKSGCDQVLRLQNVKIIGPDGKEHAGIADIEKPIILNSNKGDLTDFICTEQGDTQNSLNLKRAVASFFQTNPNKNSEIDIFGQCPTRISNSQVGEIVTISKSRNLNKCAFRESIAHNFITSTLEINNKIKSSLTLNSYFQSEQKIKEGVLVSASVVENYLLVPFSVDENGVKVTIEAKLTLTGTGNNNPITNCQIPKSIIFENPHPVNLRKSNVNIILKKVKEISEKLQTNVEDTTAIEYIDLVKLLRVSKKSDILSVYNQVRSGVGFPDKDAAKKIFLDAILTAGNEDTIQVAIELLKNKELGPIEERQLYVGLSHARHVTEASIKTATDLLNRANLPRGAYLGIGALAGRYCTHHSCENVDVINRIIQKFSGKLGDLKASNRKEESDMIFVLKGLTNIGYLNDAVLNKLVSLAEDVNQPIRLRVATLEAFGADPCKDKLRDSALKTLKDIQQDSEIRIKAYLVLAQCPNDKIGNAIKILLETEASNQVGGYIASHIKNLRSSANQDKLLARTHLGFIHTPSRFIMDPRKYSINGELSHSIDALGMSNIIEGDIIYSQNSWLPRTVNLNLTTEVLGQKFNFLEIAARQENLENVIEHYIGPQGILRKATAQQNWDNYAKPIQNLLKTLKEKVDHSLRARRDVSKAELDAINKKIEIKSNELDKNFDLDLSIKSLGSEIIFLNSFDLADKLNPKVIIDNFVNSLDKGLDKLKSFENTLRANLIILEAESTYPTSLGFPLRLGLDGASNIQVKTEGNIDVRDLLAKNTEKDVNFELSLIPSATITIVGRISLETPLLENGLKVASTIHTSSGGRLIVNTFKAGSGFDVKFSTPIKKQELVSFKHDIFFQSKENGVVSNQRLKFSQNKELSICFDQLENFFGLEFCADIIGPNLSGKRVPVLPFPFFGNAKVDLRIERGDIDTLHYRREFITSNGKKGVEAMLESYGTHSKGVGLNLQGYISPETYLKVNYISPVLSGEAEAKLINNDHEKLLSIYIKDELNLYTARAGFIISDNSTIYQPVLEYTTSKKKGPQVPPYHVEGKILVEKAGHGVKYHLEHLKVIIPGKKGISVDGFLVIHASGYMADLKFAEGSNTATMTGNLLAETNLLELDADFKNTFNPNLNFRLKGEFKKNKGLELISSDILLTHGKDLNSKTNTLNSVNMFSLENSGNDIHLITKNKFAYPLFKIYSKFELERTRSSLDYDVLLHYGEIRVGSELKSRMDAKKIGDYQLEFIAYDLKNRVEVKSSRQIVGEDESEIHNSLSVNGKRVEISGKVKHHIKPHDIIIGSHLVMKLPNSKAPLKLNGGLKVTFKVLDLHIKILSENIALIDILFKKNNNNDNANGHIKVDFKEILQVNGNFEAQKGIGNGEILLNVKSIKKSTKLDTSFNIQSQTYNIDFTIYLNNEDKDSKLTLSTKNRFTGSALDSSSSLDLLGKKLALNAKVQIGSPTNGTTLIDVDLTLPSQYLSGQLIREATNKSGSLNIETVITLEQRKNKSSPGRKLSLKGLAKNCNIQHGILDLTLNAKADDSNGHNINVDLGIKKQKIGDKWNINFDNKVTSSLLSSPIKSTCSAEYKALVGSFNWSSRALENIHVNVQGIYNFNERESPISGKLDVDVRTPLEILSGLKSSQSFKIFNIQGEDEGSVELSSSFKTISSNSPLNFDGEGNLRLRSNKQSGSFEYQGQLNKPIQISIDTSGDYKIDWSKSDGVASAYFKVVFPPGKIVQLNTLLKKNDLQDYHLDASLDLHSQQRNVVGKHNEKREISSHLVPDSQRFLLDTTMNFNSESPGINLKLVHSDGRSSELITNLNKKSDGRIVADLKVLCERRDFLLQGTLDLKLDNINDFHVLATANSPKLKVNNIFVRIISTLGRDGTGVSVLINTPEKHIVVGRATFTCRQEKGKYIVEGSGSFWVKDKDEYGSFKYISSSLTSEKDAESGKEYWLIGSLGDMTIEGDLKLTNKEFRYVNSYCKEPKECGHIKISTRTEYNVLERYKNRIEVDLDLRILGLPNEFGLKAVTKRKNFELDHTVDILLENKYQYRVYAHPKQAGISLTTPKRIIALEAEGEPGDFELQKGGKANVEISLYTDKKNRPNSRSSLKAHIDIDTPKNHVYFDLNLIVIGITKPLSMQYTRNLQQQGLTCQGSQELILDIFDRPDQKIVISQQFFAKLLKESYGFQGEASLLAKSSGLGIDIDFTRNLLLDPKAFTANYEGTCSVSLENNRHDSVIKLEVTPKDIDVVLKLMNKIILEVDSDISVQEGLVNVNTNLTGFGLKSVESKLEIKNYNTVKLIQFLKDDPSNKLSISATLIPGQIADTRAILHSHAVEKELFHASIQLDENNFLQPDSSWNSKNIKALTEKAGQLLEDLLKQLSGNIKKGAQELTNDFKQIGDIVKESISDSTESQKFYHSEINKIKEEIASDKYLESIAVVLKKSFQTVSEIINQARDITGKIRQSLNVALSGVINLTESRIMPKLREISVELGDALKELFNHMSEIFVLPEILEFAQPYLKHIATTLSQLTKEIQRFILAIYENLRDEIVGEIKRIKDEIKSSPLIANLKARYETLIKQGLPAKEFIVDTIRTACCVLKEIVVFPEFQNLIDLIEGYSRKKITNQPVDDATELNRIGRYIPRGLATIPKSLFVAMFDVVHGIELQVPSVNFELLKYLGSDTIKVSVLEYLFKEDIKPLLKFLLRFIFVPKDLLIPRTLLADLTTEIFTYDGNIFTLPANCSYLLTMDVVNGNFSVVGEYVDKKFTSFTITDKDGSVTVKLGKVLFNNVETDLPIQNGGLHVYYYTNLILIKSSAGLKATCSLEMVGCGVQISGFYHGQLRGLFGNANHEEYDDFMLPNGEIANSVSEFVSAYAVGAQCPPVAAEEAKNSKPNAGCDKLFSLESPLSTCYPFVDRHKIKRGCELAVAAGIKNVHYQYSLFYAYRCWKDNIPAYPTPEFSNKCKNSLAPHTVDEKFHVKLPGRSADILIVVNIDEPNEIYYKEYIQPLVTQLTNDFSSKGIHDVEFQLITYGGKQGEATFVTVHGKATFKDKAPNLEFSKRSEPTVLVTGIQDLDSAIRKLVFNLDELRVDLGLHLPVEIILEAVTFPFRAEAVKHIIYLVNDPCGHTAILPVLLARAPFHVKKELSVSFISPLDIKVKDPKIAKDILSFNANKVETLSDPVESSELLNDLEYDNICADQVIAVGGTVYVGENLLDNKDKKDKILGIMAKNVIDQTIGKEVHLECTCSYSYTNPFTPYNRCEHVHIVEKQT